MNLEDIIYNREMGFFGRKKEEQTGFLQIKEHLHKLNPELPDSQIAQLAANIAKEQPQDPSKRKLLQNIAKSAAGLAAVTAFPSLALARNDLRLEQLPPGVTTCTDKKLVEAYILWHQNNPKDFNRPSDRVLALNILRFGSFTMGNYYIEKDTPYTQPLYHLLSVEMDHTSRDLSNKLKKKNPALFNCAKGMGNYFIAFKTQDWRDFRMSQDEAIWKSKNYFAKSYVVACGNSESDYKTLLNRIDNMNKDQFLTNMNQNLKKQNHNNQLTAAWSGYYLTSIFELTQGGDPMQEIIDKNIKTKAGFILNNVERPPAHLLGHWIRGPPGRI